MTDKEILEYSENIIKVKSEIEAGEAAEPDLKEQIRNKFLEDSANRAKFIDSALVIGAASKEFRNVFGIDAPHYEIENCHLDIDKDENGVFDGTEDEMIPIPDPMRKGEETYYFSDCWELINASRFDSNCIVSNGLGNDPKPPVDKQRFFIDYKKNEESSPLHAPFCPPGFGRWAGNYIYDSICRNYDLNEITLYKILANVKDNTIPKSFNIDSLIGFIREGNFEFNINPDGKLAKGDFTYSFSQRATSYLTSYMSKGNVDIPYTFSVKSEETESDEETDSKEDEDLTIQAGDSSPIKWFEIRVPVKSIKVGDKYYYQYDLSNTPFAKTDNPIVQLSFRKTFGDEFNNCIAILSLDTLQSKPTMGDKKVYQYNLRYCVNIIDGGTGKFNIERKQISYSKFFYWFEKLDQSYSVTASPITELSTNIKMRLATFIKNIEEDCIGYYDKINERSINHSIPNSDKAVQIIKNLLNACNRYINWSYNTILFFDDPLEKTNWNSLMNALKQKVIFDIFGTTDVPYHQIVKIFNTTDTKTSETSISFEKSSKYIDHWESSWVPGWPRWLRKLLKWWSKPIYKDFARYKITSKVVVRNFNHQNVIKEYITKHNKYLGPSSGDISLSNDNHMVSSYKLVNEIMSQEDRNYLAKNKVIDKATNPTWIKFNGTDETTISTSDRYEIIYEEIAEERPTYDNIVRAQELNDFLIKNEELFTFAFSNLKDRIDKRTGTLRRTCSLLDSANINSQMIQQQKRNIANLFKYENAYQITGGFGSKTATIQLATWEPYTEAYANLNRLDIVYILSDITTIQEKDREKVVNRFNTNYVKATILEIIDLVSKTQYDYALTEDTDVDIKANADKGINNKKIYYRLNLDRREYEEVTDVSEALKLFERNELYERGLASQGPVFKVQLDKAIPKSFQGRNPRLVKVY